MWMKYVVYVITHGQLLLESVKQATFTQPLYSPLTDSEKRCFWSSAGYLIHECKLQARRLDELHKLKHRKQPQRIYSEF